MNSQLISSSRENPVSRCARRLGAYIQIECPRRHIANVYINVGTKKNLTVPKNVTPHVLPQSLLGQEWGESGICTHNHGHELMKIPHQGQSHYNLLHSKILEWNENAFESVVCEMAAILSRPRCAKQGPSIHGPFYLKMRNYELQVILCTSVDKVVHWIEWLNDIFMRVKTGQSSPGFLFSRATFRLLGLPFCMCLNVRVKFKG